MPPKDKTIARRPRGTERKAIAKAKKAIEDERGPAVSQAGPNRKRRRREARKNRKCEGQNIWGNPCGAPPLRPGTEIEGVKVSGRWCLNHDADVPAGTWRRLVQDRATEVIRTRPRPRRPFELLATAVEKSPAVLIQSHLKTLGLDWDPETEEFVDIGDGAHIIGFSREGYARRSKYEDLALMNRAESELMDRIFGKPRQAVELGAEGSGMAVAVIPKDAGRYRAVAKVLLEAGAIAGEDETTTNDADDELAE